jgi:putative flippase GtrA
MHLPSALKQFAAFTLVGLSNAVVDLGILNLLLLLMPTHAPGMLVLDNTIAVSLAILNSYLWNSRWTFRAAVTHTFCQRVLFLAQALLNVTLNDLMLVGLTQVLAPGHTLSFLVLSNLAKLGAMLTASLTSFLLLRLVVFRSRVELAPEAVAAPVPRHSMPQFDATRSSPR